MPGIFDPGIFDSGIFDVPTAGSFTADAVLRRTQSGSLTANAVIKRNQTGSFTADAVITAVAGAGSFTGNAVLKKTIASSFTANATLRVTRTGSFTANAIIKKTQTGTFTSDAVLAAHRTFTADAIRRRTRTGLFTANAQFLAHSFTARAVIAAVAPPPGTKISIVIRVAGVDITDDVEIAAANFTMAVNARPGSFSFTVKDADHQYQFVAGGRVTLDVAGRRAFDGYVTTATVKYAFPVDDTTDASQTPRLWTLAGPDLNILFSKRIVYDTVNPNSDFPIYPAGSSDRTVIIDALTNYLDLSGDAITYDGVTAVGSPNPDAEGYMVNRGSTWGQFMAEVAQLPGAVWGLTQDRDLFYEDANTENAPFVLSDTPNNSTSFGYSNFSWTDDGTKLANDVQAWGAGTGSTAKVFADVEDATSIADHGRWQLPGQFRSDMYRQTTITQVAESIVYGSEQNLHGGKDPYVVIQCTLKHHGLRAGQKVRLINDVYGLDAVFPIRRLTITFVNRYDVLYQAELTREIDEPWFFAEFAPYPKFTTDRWPHPPKPPRIVWPPPSRDCDEAFVIDNFVGRIDGLPDGDSWGEASSGIDWVNYDYPAVYVEAGYGSLDNTGAVGVGGSGIAGVSILDTDAHFPTGLRYGDDLDLRLTFKISDFGEIGENPDEFRITPYRGGLSMFIVPTVDPDFVDSVLTLGDGHSGFLAGASFFDWEADVLYTARFAYTFGGLFTGKIWRTSDPEPVGWMVSTTPNPSGGVDDDISFVAFANDVNAKWDFNLIELGSCIVCTTILEDDFQRSASGTWGGIWTHTGDADSVNGSEGRILGATQEVVSYTAVGDGTTAEITVQPISGTNNLNSLVISLYNGTDPTPNIAVQFPGQSSLHKVFVSNNGVFTTPNNISCDLTVSQKLRFTVTSTGVRVQIVGSGSVYVPLTDPTYDHFSVVESRAGGSTYITYGIDNFSIVNCATGSLGPVGAPTQGSWGCEVATRLSSTDYQLSMGFISGTASVYLNNRIMRLTLDYTEDPTTRTISFVDPVDVSDVVYVCYTATGMPDGYGFVGGA